LSFRPDRRTVLLVDDEAESARAASPLLERAGYRLATVGTREAALEAARRAGTAVVLLNWETSDLDGPRLCRELRRDARLPIIILSAQRGEADRIAGLELGADDCLTKPFSPLELVARVKAVLRRYESVPTGRLIRFADLTVDVGGRELRIGERAVDLRPREFDLLATLAESPGVAWKRERLLQVAWGYDWYGDTRTVDVHVAWLREKLAESRARIQTVWGVGYRLVPADEPAAGSSAEPS
jgi:DNA-binding response OmpR family regulator